MNDSMKRPRQMWKRRRPGDQFVIYVREAGMNGAKPDSLAYAQSRNEALAIQDQMEEYNPGLHVIVKPLPPSRRTPFLAPIPDGAKAVKLDAAGLASRLQRLSASFQGHATSAGREMNSPKYLIDELKHKSLIIAKHKDAADRLGATQASATLGKARQNIMRGIYWIMHNNPNEAMQVLYKVALELNEASKEVRKLV